jgi:hypothetical protein
MSISAWTMKLPLIISIYKVDKLLAEAQQEEEFYDGARAYLDHLYDEH